MNLTYLRYELIRSVRNKRAFIFSLLFPLIFFYLIAGSNRHVTLEGGALDYDFLIVATGGSKDPSPSLGVIP